MLLFIDQFVLLTNLNAYDFQLPRELIAQKPIEPRDHSKLMVLIGTEIIHRRFFNIIDYLKQDDVIVINDTKVVNARLVGKKTTGGRVELLILDKVGTHVRALIGGKRVRPGTKLVFKDITAKVVDKNGGMGTVVFERDIDIGHYGTIKLPPYIKQELYDYSRYQTVYAAHEGSIAAPTAGLHFTPTLIQALLSKNIKIAKITLHIGYATFMPVKEQDITKHVMHEEYFTIPESAAMMINNRRGKLIAIGTTVVRALESATINGTIAPQTAKTRLFIYPGYVFKSGIDMLVTNFHIPHSSLLMLVCAFGGYARVLNAYKIAIKRKYRFYSFGDAMLIDQKIDNSF